MGKKKKITVLHITDTLALGGREILIANLSNRMVSDGHAVSILTLSDESSALKARLSPDIRLHSLGLKNKKQWNPLTGLTLLPAIVRIIKENHIEVVHTHLSATSLYIVALACRIAGVKHCQTVHSAGFYYEAKNLKDRMAIGIEAAALRITNGAVVAVYDNIQANNIRYFGNSKTIHALILNGVDTSLFNRSNYTTGREALGFSANDTIIVYVGRMDKPKNHQLLIEAFGRLCLKENTDTLKLLLIGDGDERRNLETYCQNKDWGKQVIFTGNIENVASYLAISDIAAFPSVFEGLPLVLAEMMLMELPVVASDIAVFIKEIKEGETGYIARKNDADDWVEKLALICNDKPEQRRMGELAKAYASDRFALDRMVGEYIQLYERLLERKG